MKLIVVVLLLVMGMIHAKNYYDVAIHQMDDGVCQVREAGNCYQCADKYYYIHLDEYSGDVFYTVSDTLYDCENSHTNGIQAEETSCNSTIPACQVTYSSVYNLFILDVESTSPISMYLLPVRYYANAEPMVELTSTTALLSNGVEHAIFQSGGSKLRVVDTQISNTQYLTNFGVLNIGQQYSFESFSFVLTKKVLEDIDSIKYFVGNSTASISSIVQFAPFTNIAVASDVVVPFAVSDFELKMFLQSTEVLQNVTIGVPTVSFSDIVMYPPYEDPSSATMVYQIEELSTYGDHACDYHYESSKELSTYLCYFSGLASIIVEIEKYKTSTDDMAFELF